MLELPPREDSHWKDKLRRIDFPGAIVLVGAVLGFLVGLDRGSNVSWSMPTTIVSLSVSAVLFVLFIVVEVFYAAEPFAPGHIIFDRAFVSSYACNFFSFGGWLAALFYIPLYFQAVDGVSATVAGLRLLPSIFAGVSGSLFAGFVMKWTGKFYWLTIISYALLTTGMSIIFLSSGAVQESLVWMIMGMVFSGFGNGIGVTSTLISLSESPHQHMAMRLLSHSYLPRCSFKFDSRRSGRGDRLLVSLPISRLCHRSLFVVHRGPTGSSDPTAFCVTRQQGRRSDC